MPTYYGEWTQGPNYTGPGRVVDGALLEGPTVASDIKMPPQDEQPNQAMNDAVAAAPVGPFSGGGASLSAFVDVEVRHIVIQSPATPILGTEFYVTASSGGARFSAFELRVQQSAFWQYGWPPPPWPPGAVGVEYEATTATVLSASGAWTYTDLSVDTSAGQGAHRPVAGSGRVELVASGSAVVSQTLLGAGETNSGTIDLSSHMLGENGEIPLEVSLIKSGRFDAADNYWGYDDPADSPGRAVAGTRLGGGFTLPVTYTLRPPRHRFLYDRALVSPPTRVFPRDDGRLTAAAARVWPPPRSVQGSNRSGPGSYT